MQKQRLLPTLTFVAGCATTLIISWSLLRNAPQTAKEPVLTAVEGAGNGVHDSDNASTNSELARLRAELRSKDIALRAAAIVPGGADSEPTAPTAEAPTLPAQDPIAMACDLLDERMLTAPVEGRKSVAMEQAISNMIQSSAVPSRIVASTHCGSTLCKVVLRDSTPGELASALRKVSENAPKMFGGVIAFDSSPGEKSLYFAKDGNDIQLDPSEELSAVHRITVPAEDATPTPSQPSKNNATL